MHIAILTFQFAHNYGALLQTFALKQYLQSLGHDVDVAPYYPQWAQKEYANSPFAKGISLKKRIRLTVLYPKRKRIVARFEDFKKNCLKLSEYFTTESELKVYLNRYDVVVFGSDQIWNNNITDATSAYFGNDISPDRVAYAASLGTNVLTEVQKQNAKKYLPRFKAISVRESLSKDLLEQVVKETIHTVVDPVFLLSQEDWESECTPVKLRGKFMFLYFLRDDQLLLEYAYKYAKAHDLPIYEVHPTLARFHTGCIPIIDVGPREFLWLIKNSECVCTNSFHATSFSFIFRKKLLHIPNEVSPERTESLLSYLGIDVSNNGVNLPLYDLSKCNYSIFDAAVNESKQYLLQIGER